MIKKSILIVLGLLNFNAYSNSLPQPEIQIKTSNSDFNQNYSKTHNTKESAINEIKNFFETQYNTTPSMYYNNEADYETDYKINIKSTPIVNESLFNNVNFTKMPDNKFGKYSQHSCLNTVPYYVNTSPRAWFKYSKDNPDELIQIELYWIADLPQSNYILSSVQEDENGVSYLTTWLNPEHKIYLSSHNRTFGSGNSIYHTYNVCEVEMNEQNNINIVKNAQQLPSEEFELVQNIDVNRVNNCKVGNPCDVYSGAKMQEEIDFIAKNIVFSRYYNSYNSFNYDSTGYPGWTHSYSNKILEPINFKSKEILIHDFKNNANKYKKVSENFYIGLYEENTSVEILRNEKEVYENRNGKTYVYNLDTGLLKRILDNDLITILEYDLNEPNLLSKVKTNLNEELVFVYEKINNTNYLKKVTLNNNQEIELFNEETINGDYNLVSYNYFNNNTFKNSKTYHYEDTNFNSLLTGITDEKGIRYATWAYDELGKAVLSEHADGYNKITIERIEELIAGNPEWFEPDYIMMENIVTNSKNSKTNYYVNKKQGKGLVDGYVENYGTSSESYENLPFYGYGENNQYIRIEKYNDDTDNPVDEYSIEDVNSYTTIKNHNQFNQVESVKVLRSKFNNVTFEEERVEEEKTTYIYSKNKEKGGSYRVQSIESNDLMIEYDYLESEELTFNINNPLNIPNRDLIGNLVEKITMTDLTNNSIPYSTSGNIKEIKIYYNEDLDIKAIDGARTDVNDIVFFEYESKGLLKYAMSEECTIGSDYTNLSYNLLNQNCRYISYSNYTQDYGSPQTIVDENGLTTNIIYNSKNLVEKTTTITQNGNLETIYNWNELDLIEKVTLPNGSWLEYTYNNARYLTKIENSLGEVIEYDIDTEGLTTERRIKSSTGTIVQQQNWVYSLNNKLLKTISGNLFETNYNYVERRSDLKSITDHLGNVNEIVFNGLGKVKREIDPLSGEISRMYDYANNQESVIDQKGNQTTYTLDGFGNVIRIDSPDTGISDMWYDEADNMIKKVLADGTEINYVYDVSDRLTDIIYPDTTLNVHFDYDTATYGKGKIALITYKHGSIAYTYNELGLVDTQTNIINNEIYVTSYQYTNWGTLNGITYPSGRQVDYILDSIDRVTGISVDGQILINNVEYLPFGSFKSFDYGNGISFSGTFDKDYLVRNVTHTNAGNDIFNETYDYEKMYQINAITDNLDSNKNQSFTYDAKSQLINAIGNYGDYQYTLDPVGNRLSKTVNMTETETYNVDTLSNKLLSIDKGNESRTLNYDANGNVIEDIGYDLTSKTLTYGDNNRLIDVDGYIYGYNPMNQRVIDNGKINNYDLNGQLISVNDGNLIIEYIYLGNMKIAMLQDNGIDLNTYYAHNNYMGLPRLFTDENMNIVWSGDFTPFGELFNENGSVSNLIRFTGQYENIETGYFYNYHRDYDASLGRYLQSDPIGLNGGINTYAYVAGNPINFIDPLGLKCACADPLKLINVIIEKDGTPKKDGTDWRRIGNSGDWPFWVDPTKNNKCNRYVDYYFEKAGGYYPNVGGGLLSRILGLHPASPSQFGKGDVPGFEEVGLIEDNYNNLKVGDMLINKNGSHIGIYIGNNKSISANPQKGARVLPIEEGYENGKIFRCNCE